MYDRDDPEHLPNDVPLSIIAIFSNQVSQLEPALSDRVGIVCCLAIFVIPASTAKIFSGHHDKHILPAPTNLYCRSGNTPFPGSGLEKVLISP